MTTVHVHTATQLGLIVNVFAVETAEGIVLIDGGVALSSSRAVRTLIDETLGKPILAVLLTHGHPDHYMGIAEILNGRSVPIHALAGGERQARARDAEEAEGMRQAFGTDFPERRVFPNNIVADGAVLEIGGLTFRVRDYGAAESDSDAVWWFEEAGQATVFCGDIIYNNMHLFMKDGHAPQWLAALDRLAADFPENARFLPAHGQPCGHEGIAWTQGYINHYLRTLKGVLDGQGALAPAAQTAFIADLKTFLPSDDLIQLAAFKLDETVAKLGPVAAEIASP
jgi:glyoxylase-like metal-dependent hydrolase (beta-lactamase superfamily II)